MEKVEFEFPDEASENPRKGGAVVETENKKANSADSENDSDIEIVDDTPPQDRNRKPMEEPPKEMNDDELAKYDESVKKRIQHFTKGYHEERRAKEAAQREKEEAIRLAQAVIDENKRLKGSLNVNQNALIEQAKRTVANEIEEAKRQYKTAYESGDSDALVSAQEALTTAKMKAEKINNFRPASLQTKETEVQTQQPRQPAPQVDPKLLAWQEKNQWFGSNKKMTAYALGLHEDLVSEGIQAGSGEYYERIDAEMRERFADKFESAKDVDAQPQRAKSNVVSPATRSTAPKKVVLTKSQVDLAKRLGVPLELYARQVIAEQMRK
jgi:hypothetical protein